MISSHDRADLIQVMKINRLTLSEADSAHLTFNGWMSGGDYEITVLVVEDTPLISIEKNGTLIHSETVSNADDLKIFLEERLYKYLEA